MKECSWLVVHSNLRARIFQENGSQNPLSGQPYCKDSYHSTKARCAPIKRDDARKSHGYLLRGNFCGPQPCPDILIFAAEFSAPVTFRSTSAQPGFSGSFLLVPCLLVGVFSSLRCKS